MLKMNINRGVITQDQIQVEIDETVLSALIESGVLAVEDIRCLNRGSKNTVKKLCLKACSKKM